MAAKSNGISIFLGIEQGSGPNTKNVYVYFKSSMATEAKEQIRRNFGTIFKINRKKEYEISLPKVIA